MSSLLNGKSKLNQNNTRYCRSWKCQVSVGELYRWILAKLSDKDIKRALHKYRDLMPRQSDWNRKLTQATNMPELGFRYLYRCGQIDESNHRTMQKMLKYIDRQDVLPYFDSILYNSNHANCSLDELQKVLLDKVSLFLENSTVLTEDEVHPEPPYEIIQCQPIESDRITRSSLKRKSYSMNSKCPTLVKRPRLSGSDDLEADALQYCKKVRSSIVANALSGPIIHTMLSTSLISMLATLRTTLCQVLEESKSSSVSSSTYPFNSNLNLDHPLLSSHLLAMMPHLLAAARFNPISHINLMANNLSMPMMRPNAQRLLMPRFLPNHNVRPMPNQADHSDANGRLDFDENLQNELANARNRAVPFINMADPNGLMLVNPNNNDIHNNQRVPDIGAFGASGLIPPLFPAVAAAAAVSQSAVNPPVLLRHVVLSAGGVGITTSPHDSLIKYYCNIKLYINIDFGPSLDMLPPMQNVRQDPFERQIDQFAQAVNFLRSRTSGEFVCSLHFTHLNQLEDFWADYQSGALRTFLMSVLLSPVDRSFVGEPMQSSQSSDNNNFSSAIENRAESVRGDHGARNPFNGQDNSNLVDHSTFDSANVTNCTDKASTSVLSNFNSTKSPLLTSMDILGDVFQKIRKREFFSLMVDRQPNRIQDFKLNLFVSRREYENGRCLLVRNLRMIPSLCKLVTASNLFPTNMSNPNDNTDHK